jgi:hypothetical protein
MRLVRMGKDQGKGKSDRRRNYASLFLPQSNSIVAAVIGLGIICFPSLPLAIADEPSDIRIGVTGRLWLRGSGDSARDRACERTAKRRADRGKGNF